MVHGAKAAAAEHRDDLQLVVLQFLLQLALQVQHRAGDARARRKHPVAVRVARGVGRARGVEELGADERAMPVVGGARGGARLRARL